MKWLSGHQLVPKADAEAYARKLADNGARILGIEGFIIDGDQIVPQMHLIADFSTAPDHQAALVEALHFVDRCNDPAVYFYFTT